MCLFWPTVTFFTAGRLPVSGQIYSKMARRDLLGIAMLKLLMSGSATRSILDVMMAAFSLSRF